MLAIFLAQIRPSLLPSLSSGWEGEKENLLSLHPTRKAANDYTCLRASSQKRGRKERKKERRREGAAAAFSCPLLPRGAITDTSALFPSFILLPSFHSGAPESSSPPPPPPSLPSQAKPFCPLSRTIWCLFSVLVCPTTTDVWRLSPSVVQSAGVRPPARPRYKV